MDYAKQEAARQERRRQEDAKRTLLRNSWPVLARAIGERLSDAGKVWTFQAPEGVHSAARMTRDDGLAIYITLDEYKRRVHCSPSVPKRNNSYVRIRDWGVGDWNDSDPSRSCSADREPAVIAKEFTRHVVDVYAPLYAKILEKQREHLDQHAAAKELARTLADKTGGRLFHVNHRDGADPLTAMDDGNGVTLYVGDTSGKFYGEMRISAYGSVDLQLRSINADAAVEIAAFLGNLHGKVTK